MANSPQVIKGIIILTSLTLSACSQLQPAPPEIFHSTQGPIRTTTAGPIGRLFALNKTTSPNGLIKQLYRYNIQYVQYGDLNTLIVPTDKYYEFNSPKLNDVNYPGLIITARLLQHYENCPIYVAGFSDNIGTDEHKEKLSQARAETMVGFLWANNIEAQRFHAQGYGDKHAIGDNDTMHGSAYNRRIEIQWVSNGPHKCEPAQIQAQAWK